MEAGKVALLGGESTRRVAAQRLEEWHYDAALEHEKPRIARHERPPPWPLPLPLAPPPSPDPHRGPIRPRGARWRRMQVGPAWTAESSRASDEQPASGWIWARWRSR